MAKITGFETHDVRFPTSRALDGSDAMNPDPDYSAAYVVVRIDDGSAGHGFAFTIGRGNEVELAAIKALEPLLVGLDVDEVLGDLGGVSRRLVGESQLRWLGPEKGVIHMAIGAVTNALFDLAANRAGKPLWRYLCDQSPQDLVNLIDFRYLTDAITPAEALELFERGAVGKGARIAELEQSGYPAYTSSPGWLGYSDEHMTDLCGQALADGFGLIKLKVGADLEQDRARCSLARRVIGNRAELAVDANQVWEVDQAVAWVRALDPFGLAWVEEPTNADDVLGYAKIRTGVRPVPVATGETVANRVMFKQLLQAEAMDVMQIDACRVAGVPENVANLALAAKFGVRVCPHAGGVGLCEVVRHLAFFDYAALSTSMTNRWIEWIDHLHEHFVDPAVVSHGRYVAPSSPGASTEMRAASLVEFAFPSGPVWSSTPR